MDQQQTQFDKPGFFNDPDAQNSEQAEEQTQAQQVERDAATVATDLSEESAHGGAKNAAAVVPDDAQDLVDQMEHMRRTGRIDMNAYRNEPESMDDEDGSVPE